MDLAELELKGWSDWVVCGGGAVSRGPTIASLPLAAEWRTEGSRVMVIRTGESGLRLGCSMEEGSGLGGRLDKPMQRMRTFYRYTGLDPV